jgi:hypothetical protein
MGKGFEGAGGDTDQRVVETIVSARKGLHHAWSITDGGPVEVVVNAAALAGAIPGIYHGGICVSYHLTHTGENLFGSLALQSLAAGLV